MQKELSYALSGYMIAINSAQGRRMPENIHETLLDYIQANVTVNSDATVTNAEFNAITDALTDMTDDLLSQKNTLPRLTTQFLKTRTERHDFIKTLIQETFQTFNIAIKEPDLCTRP